MLMTRRALSSSRSFSLDLVHSEGAGHRRAAPLVRVTVGRRLVAAKLLARVRDTLCWPSTRGALGWSPQPVRPRRLPCPPGPSVPVARPSALLVSADSGFGVGFSLCGRGPRRSHSVTPARGPFRGFHVPHDQ